MSPQAIQPLNVLVLGAVWPEPQSSAAGWRTLSLLEAFQQFGWQVCFASAAADSPHRTSLTERGIEELPIQLNHASFDQMVAERQPDVVVFDRFMTEEQFGWRVEQHCPGALRMLDMQDLHALRRARQHAQQENRALTEQDLFSEAACREIASILRCDLSLVISSHEMELLRNAYGVPVRHLHQLPFLLQPPTASAQAQWPTFESRGGYLTIGNFRHAPNWDSVVHLKQTVWPLIRARQPDARLRVYGAYPPKKATALHDPAQGFQMLGWADDARQVLQQARVCLAPLRFGAGLKGKLAEAMACGTPSVTTPIGAEGMAGKLAWSGCIESAPDAFADAAVALYHDPDRWQIAQHNGAAILDQSFNRDRLLEPFRARILDHRSRLEQDRNSNFLGRMLRQHRLHSTRYMALWIEEKNKRR